MGTGLPRGIECALVALATELAAASAHGQALGLDDSGEARDERTLSGLGTALNFRGAPDEFAADFAASGGKNRLAVEALRLSARVVILPELAKSSESWAGFLGVRMGGLHYATFAASGDDVPALGVLPANIEPTIGLVIESIADEVRFEADVAPVVSMALSSQIASQAAIYAATSMAPHDDLLFLPNTRGGARLRLSLSRRFRFSSTTFLAIGAEVETGYARAATLLGTSEGGTGGGAMNAQLYVRTPRRSFEGWGIALLADVGYTSIWTANVVLPLLFSAGPTLQISRDVQARLMFSASTPNPAVNLMNGLFPIDSWGGAFGMQWSFEGPTHTWAKSQVELEPELLQLDVP